MNSRAGSLSPARRGPAHLEVADGHSGLITRADDIEERHVLQKRPRRRVVVSSGMRSLIRILKRQRKVGIKKKEKKKDSECLLPFIVYLKFLTFDFLLQSFFKDCLLCLV